MDRTFSAVIAALVLAHSSLALADVGPPPTCPAGQHREYLYGHRCVPDGSHLARDPEGGVVIVKNGTPNPQPKPSSTVMNPKAPGPIDGSELLPSPSAAPTPTPTPTPAPTPSAAPPPPAASIAPVSDTPVSPAPAPPPQRGCTCGIPGEPEERIGFGVVIAALVFAVHRRMSKDRAAG